MHINPHIVMKCGGRVAVYKDNNDIFLLFFGVAMVREKYVENEIFCRSGNFVDGQGNLERTWKVREKSGNLKINSYSRQSSVFIYSVQEGKVCTCL